MAKAEATVEELVGMIERGELRLPEMQRQYVWRSTRVRDLLDSLYRGYPSGAILVWETDEEESRPRGSHPQPLAERYVNVSAHTAPVKQTHLSSPRASEQTILGCASYTVQRTPWRQSSCASVT